MGSDPEFHDLMAARRQIGAGSPDDRAWFLVEALKAVAPVGGLQEEWVDVLSGSHHSVEATIRGDGERRILSKLQLGQSIAQCARISGVGRSLRLSKAAFAPELRALTVPEGLGGGPSARECVPVEPDGLFRLC